MKKLNLVALGCFLVLNPLVVFAQKAETEVIKAFDGSRAHCQTKS